MRFYGVAMALAVVLGFAAATQAAPLDQSQVPADAKWLAHVDVDNMRSSTFAQKAWQMVAQMHKELPERLEKIRDNLGIDVCKDLHGVTLFGKELGKHTGVMIVNAKFDQELLLKKAEGAKDHKVTKYGAYDLHSWTERFRKDHRTAWGAIYKPEVIVFASSEEELKAAFDVLDGKSPGIGSDSPLNGELQPGTTLTFRASGLADADLPCKSPIAKQIESLRMGSGEKDGQKFLNIMATVKNTETAENLKTVVEGFKAMGALHAGTDEQAKKLVDAIEVKADGAKLTIHWKGSSDELWSVVEKHAKKMAELKDKGHKPESK